MMKKRRKKFIRAQTLVFSLLLLIALTYSVPASASDISVKVRTGYSQVDGKTKHQFNREYQAKKKSAKADYRRAVRALKTDLNRSIQLAKTKGDRTEARKKFHEGLKTAQQRLDITLKELKETYKKQISD
jgi:hypothetical protein